MQGGGGGRVAEVAHRRAEGSQKANERAALKMLREKLAAFAELEAKGLIETVQIAPNVECEGYTVRAEKPAREKQAQQKRQEREVSKTKRVSSERLRKRKRPKREKAGGRLEAAQV